MPFLRVSRDERGYENTFLLHAAYPGDRPRVLYWYRSAPGVRVGRPPLDEDAIRSIEEHHPEIEFDWPQILEEVNTLPPEIERRQERPRRKPQTPREQEVVTAEPTELARQAHSDLPQATEAARIPAAHLQTAPVQVPQLARNQLLDELVGREIAARLRSRFQDVQGKLDQVAAGHPARAAWQSRADALNPDSWTTAEAILSGVQRADRLFDELRRELP